MSTLQNLNPLPRPAGTPWMARLAWLIDTVLHPRSVIADIESWRALVKQADRLEATDPTRAAVLRHRAARIGLD
jgi:hypothetical protein